MHLGDAHLANDHLAHRAGTGCGCRARTTAASAASARPACRIARTSACAVRPTTPPLPPRPTTRGSCTTTAPMGHSTRGRRRRASTSASSMGRCHGGRLRRASGVARGAPGRVEERPAATIAAQCARRIRRTRRAKIGRGKRCTASPSTGRCCASFAMIRYRTGPSAASRVASSPAGQGGEQPRTACPRAACWRRASRSSSHTSDGSRAPSSLRQASRSSTRVNSSRAGESWTISVPPCRGVEHVLVADAVREGRSCSPRPRGRRPPPARRAGPRRSRRIDRTGTHRWIDPPRAPRVEVGHLRWRAGRAARRLRRELFILAGVNVQPRPTLSSVFFEPPRSDVAVRPAVSSSCRGAASDRGCAAPRVPGPTLLGASPRHPPSYPEQSEAPGGAGPQRRSTGRSNFAVLEVPDRPPRRRRARRCRHERTPPIVGGDAQIDTATVRAPRGGCQQGRALPA